MAFFQHLCATIFIFLHHNYSRIDYFFLDKKLLSEVKACSDNSIVISDHAQLTLSILFQEKISHSGGWRFNSLLLSDQAFCEVLKAQLDIFLELNTIPETAPSMIWEAL